MTTANLTVIGNVLFKRGNTTVASAYTGVPGEIIIDTTLQTIRIQDGVTPGGQVLASAQDAANVANANTSALLSNAAVQATSINAFNANLGAYQIFANANAATQATSLVSVNANVTAANSSITTLQTQVYANANVATYLSAFDGNILPAANVTYSLGSETRQWRDLWVSNNTIYIGNTPVRVDGNTLLVNGAPVGGSYNNANVATYLPTYTGNITAGNVSATGNVNAGQFNFANGVNIFDTITGVTSINTSVSTLTVSDASGDYTYGALSYDYAVNGASNSFSIQYSAPLAFGNVDINVGNVIATSVSTSTVITTPVALANLAAISGARAFVNDANIAAAGNFGAAISGGGSNTAPVWSDGVNWYIG